MSLLTYADQELAEINERVWSDPPASGQKRTSVGNRFDHDGCVGEFGYTPAEYCLYSQRQRGLLTTRTIPSI